MNNYLRNPLLFFVTASALIFSSCRKNDDGPVVIDPVQIPMSSDQLSLVGSANSFAFDIFSRVTGNAGGENLIISPLSISVALSMTLNGASGETRTAMLAALRSSGLTAESINIAYRDLSKALLSVDPRVAISIANSVWTKNDFPAKKTFGDLLTQYYNADTRSFDINDPSAVKEVNAWIEGKTNGLITKMIDQMDPQTVMLLINAIYFKGKWNSQFDAGNTVNEVFYKTPDLSVEVPVMKQKNKFKAFANEGYKIAEFPYGRGNFVMDVILPDDVNGANNIIRTLTQESFNQMVEKMHEQEVEVSFPKFKYGYKKTLNGILSDMGMGVAFSDMADFSNIADEDLFISMVLHQAFIETNEEGTEAAAATVVGISTTSMPVGPMVFRLDHPFVYIIRETSTNSVLFMGRVSDPLAG